MTTNKQNIKRPEYWTARIQNSSTIALSNSGHQYTKYKQKVCFCHWKIYLKSAYWQQISRYRCANHENFTTTTTSEHPAPPTPLSIPPSPPPPFESCLNRHWSCLDLHQLSAAANFSDPGLHCLLRRHTAGSSTKLSVFNILFPFCPRGKSQMWHFQHLTGKVSTL